MRSSTYASNISIWEIETIINTYSIQYWYMQTTSAVVYLVQLCTYTCKSLDILGPRLHIIVLPGSLETQTACTQINVFIPCLSISLAYNWIKGKLITFCSFTQSCSSCVFESFHFGNFGKHFQKFAYWIAVFMELYKRKAYIRTVLFAFLLENGTV